MITKRNFLDLLSNRLSGGITVKDVQKMYPTGVISKVVNLALADVVRRDRLSAMEMAITYDYTPVQDGTRWYVTLSPMTIAGTMGIVSVEDDKTTYIIQNSNDRKAILVLRGNDGKGATLTGTKVYFSEKPKGTVYVSLVPNVYEMEDTDILLPNVDDLGLGEADFFKVCLQMLMTPQYQDELNNAQVDVQHTRGN